MNGNLEIVCELFSESIDLLEDTYKMYVPSEVLEKVKEAEELLKETRTPLLDLYNVDKTICKEIYSDARDFRETALTYLFYAISTLEKFGSEIDSCTFGDVDDYIREAVCWIEKTKYCLHCEPSTCCDSTCSSVSSISDLSLSCSSLSDSKVSSYYESSSPIYYSTSSCSSSDSLSTSCSSSSSYSSSSSSSCSSCTSSYCSSE